MFVCALVLAVGLAAVMGILYSNFDGQMRKELSKEAAYLTYGVEQQGVDYRSEEHTSELQSPVPIAYAVFCLKKIFFNDTATTEIYTLSLHDALPI